MNLKQAAAYIRKALHRDPARTYSYARVRCHGEVMRLESTDGHRLHAATVAGVTCPGTPDAPVTLYLTDADLAKLGRGMLDFHAPSLREDPGYPPTEECWRTPADIWSFVAYASAIRTSAGAIGQATALSAKYVDLARTAKKGGYAITETPLPNIFAEPGGELMINGAVSFGYAGWGGFFSKTTEVPASERKGEGVVHLNCTYLLEAVPGKSTVTVRGAGKLDPVVLSGEGFAALVMPMRT